MVRSSATRLTGELPGPFGRPNNQDPLNAKPRSFSRPAQRSLGHDRVHDAAAIDMRVAQLLCSRLCHDLVGAAGAIHNGVELMNEDGGGDPSALSLVAASSTHLNSRLAFYRVAFGLGGGANRVMSLDEAGDLARGVVESGRVRLDWRIAARDGTGPGMSHSLDGIRLILGLVLIGADALPRGGTLCVRCAESGAGLEVSISARGSNARVPDTIRAAMDLDVPSDALTARTVHGYFAAALARRLDTAISIEETNPDEVVLTVSPPRPRQAGAVPFPTH